jgi:hypothetical protein
MYWSFGYICMCIEHQTLQHATGDNSEWPIVWNSGIFVLPLAILESEHHGTFPSSSSCSCLGKAVCSTGCRTKYHNERLCIYGIHIRVANRRKHQSVLNIQLADATPVSRISPEIKKSMSNVVLCMKNSEFKVCLTSEQQMLFVFMIYLFAKGFMQD